jgi:hypothetical protein
MADEQADNADWLRHAVVADRIKIATLEEAVRRLAKQDATLSVCDGNVTVTLDATLTDEEREAIREACDEGRWYPQDYHHIHTLRCLLERLFGERHGSGAANNER